MWLGSEPQALIVIILADVWKTAPFMALLILAGLQVIPGEIYEAAKVDGATTWQRFTRITLPLLTPAILVALIFRTLDALRIFDLPYVLTDGQNGTSTLSTIAQETFATNRIYGLGAAMAVLTFIVVMIVSFSYIQLRRRQHPRTGGRVTWLLPQRAPQPTTTEPEVAKKKTQVGRPEDAVVDVDRRSPRSSSSACSRSTG